MEIKIDAVIPVPDFFWIPEEDFIGFDQHALHDDKLKSGSVDEGCSLEIRHIEHGRAIVSLIRPTTPYGAQAAVGTVFWIDVSRMDRWPDLMARNAEKEKRRSDLAARFCK